MNWTGQLYGIYAGMPIEKVFEKLKQKAQEIDYKFNYSKYKEEESLLFYKNDEMLDFHLENGYNTSMNEEGCFSVEAKIQTYRHELSSIYHWDYSGLGYWIDYDLTRQICNSLKHIASKDQKSLSISL